MTKDRVGQVWERNVGDGLDDMWVVIGAPFVKHGELYHPSASLITGEIVSRYETTLTNPDHFMWERSPNLKRHA